VDNIEITQVTPDLASSWLLSNTHNRNLRRKVVTAYAADMASGNWRWNGESVKFSEDDVLLDGQHRLAAIVEANVTLPGLVIRGLPSETQETVDGGARRKFGDVLRLRGERNGSSLAAIVRRVTVWEDGARRVGSKTKYPPTTGQLLATLEKHPELREIAGEAHGLSRQCDMPGSILALGIWLFGQLSPEDSSFFFGRLADFQGLIKGDPIYELRRALERSRSSQHERSETFLLAIMIKAWNAYRDGARVGLLTYRPGGARPETFPEPR
jgi:hypothetical protein